MSSAQPQHLTMPCGVFYLHVSCTRGKGTLVLVYYLYKVTGTYSHAIKKHYIQNSTGPVQRQG